VTLQIVASLTDDFRGVLIFVIIKATLLVVALTREAKARTVGDTQHNDI